MNFFEKLTKQQSIDIFNYLDIPSKFNLHLTNKFFYKIFWKNKIKNEFHLDVGEQHDLPNIFKCFYLIFKGPYQPPHLETEKSYNNANEFLITKIIDSESIGWRCYVLSWLHLKTNWSKRSPVIGIEYCKQAIEHKQAKAATLMAELTQDGLYGLTANATQAEKYYLLAIKLGDSVAAYKLAKIYLHGNYGFNKSPEKSINYLIESAKMRNNHAAKDLGLYYRKGLHGLTVNLQKLMITINCPMSVGMICKHKGHWRL